MKKLLIPLSLLVVAISGYSARPVQALVGEYYHKIKGDAYSYVYIVSDYMNENQDELYNMGMTGIYVDKDENVHVSIANTQNNAHTKQRIENKLHEIIGEKVDFIFEEDKK